MSYFHVRLAAVPVPQEGGSQPQVTQITSRVQVGTTDPGGDPIYVEVTQYHSMAPALQNPPDDNVLMAVEWDCISPYVILHKGTYDIANMRFMGWPEITQEEWEALQP